MAEIRIEAVEFDPAGNGETRSGWRWSCDCHDWASPPWPDPLTEATAVAEHEVVFGERKPARVGAWVR